MSLKKLVPPLLAMTLFFTACTGKGDGTAAAETKPAAEAAASQETAEGTAASAETASDTDLAAREDAESAEGAAATDGAAAADGTAADGTVAADGTASADGTAAADGTTAADGTAAADGASADAAGVIGAETLAPEAASEVSLIIPADLIEGSTQEDLNAKAAQYSLDSFILNADGTAALNATKAAHTAMLAALSTDYSAQIAQLKGSEDLPSVLSVGYTEDFTTFIVNTAGDDLSDKERILCEYRLLVPAYAYNAYAGNNVASFHINWVNENSGEIFISEDKTLAQVEDELDGLYAAAEPAPEATSADVARIVLSDTLTQNLNPDFASTIADNETIQFLITGARVDDYAYYWSYHAENRTAKTLSFSSSVNTSVNGILCNPTLILELAPGESTDGEMSWSLSNLLEAHITDVTAVDFGLSVFDNESYNSVYEAFTMLYPTGETRAMTEFYHMRDHEDQLMMDNQYAVIIANGYDSSDIYDLIIDLYIQNNYDTELTFEARNFRLDGISVSNFWMSIMPAGKGNYCEINFPKGIMEDINLTTINQVEFDLVCYDMNNANEPFCTIPVSLSPAFG